MKEPQENLELVANIWPIVDGMSNLIQRIAARAYVLPAGQDSLISTVLLGLATSDFVMAKQFRIPTKFIVQSEFGEIRGAIDPGGFNLHLEEILDPILEDLAAARPEVVGVSFESGEPQGKRPIVRFGDDPYTTITFLREEMDGRLVPQLPGS